MRVAHQPTNTFTEYLSLTHPLSLRVTHHASKNVLAIAGQPCQRVVATVTQDIEVLRKLRTVPRLQLRLRCVSLIRGWTKLCVNSFTHSQACWPVLFSEADRRWHSAAQTSSSTHTWSLYLNACTPCVLVSKKSGHSHILQSLPN